MIDKLRAATRWTPFAFVHPRHYVATGPFWEQFDLEGWTQDFYTWESDGWNGYRDFAQEPTVTVASGYGDCEDYALVAASTLLARDVSPVRIGFCWESGKPHPTHAICYGGGHTYSSGEITEESVHEYRNRTKYSVIIGRLVK